MKKVLTVLAALLAVSFAGISINSKNLESSKVDDLLQIDGTLEKLTPFDIIWGTGGGTPHMGRTRSVALPSPILGSVGETILKINFSVTEIFTIQVKDKATGAIIYNSTANSAITPEISIDIQNWDSGDYTIYFYKQNPASDNDYYHGDFSIK